MNFLLKIFLVIGLFSLSSFSKEDFKVEKLVSNLEIPWGMTFISENQLLITQRNSKVLLLDIKKRSYSLISNTPKVLNYSQGGLLDVQISPNYKTDSWIYFTYSKDLAGQGVTTLARAKLDKLRLHSWEDLLITESSSNKGVHFGSRVTFDEKGHLFFSIGDRGVRPSAQDLSNHAGTIVRLYLDGTVPKDNPFVGVKGAMPEIYSFGHRNPQGLFYDKTTKRLWSVEHGPRGGDEINLILEGKNYGWPVISYGKEYYAPISVGEGTSKIGMEQPVKVYIPSIAPSSLIVYSGKVFKEWKGNIFVGALKLRHLNRIVLNEKAKFQKEYRLLKSLKQRIRNVIEGPDGLIYFSTDSGNIYRIVRK